jgi:hypothetical protein
MLKWVDHGWKLGLIQNISDVFCFVFCLICNKHTGEIYEFASDLQRTSSWRERKEKKQNKNKKKLGFPMTLCELS